MTTYYQRTGTANREETSETTLQRFEWYITLCATHVLRTHTLRVPPEVADLEKDELIQRTRIKLWRILEKKHIDSPYTYIKRIVYSTFIDMKRQQRAILPLPINEEEYQASMTLLLTESTTDLAESIEQQFEASTRLEEVIQLVLALPTRQRLAMICSLKERVDDVIQLTASFKKHHVNIEPLHWPDEEVEKQALRASLTIARLKLARKIKPCGDEQRRRKNQKDSSKSKYQG